MPDRPVDRRRDLELRRLIEEYLHSSSRSLGIIQEHVESMCKDSQANKKQEDIDTPPAPPPRIDMHFPESVTTYYQSKNDKAKSFNWKFWTPVLINFATLIAVAVYASITNRQKDTMADTLDLMRKQMRATQSAAIVVDPNIEPPDAILMMYIRNNGNGVARDVRLTYKADRRPILGGSVIETSGERVLYFPKIGIPGEGLKATAGLRTDRYAFPGSGPNMWSALQHTAETVRIEGTLTYDDGFGPVEPEKFCESWLWYSARGGLQTFFRFEPCDGFENLARTAIEKSKESRPK